MAPDAIGEGRREPLLAGIGRAGAVLVLAVGLAQVAATAASKGAGATVVIDGTSYHPATITVKKGEAVRWINTDPFPHTVTSAGAFDSKEIPANGSWKYVARKPGRYDYVCTLHPNMKGTLVVE